jgi:hypothetical protein
MSYDVDVETHGRASLRAMPYFAMPDVIPVRRGVLHTPAAVHRDGPKGLIFITVGHRPTVEVCISLCLEGRTLSRCPAFQAEVVMMILPWVDDPRL